MKKLSATEIQEKLSALPGWALEGDFISKTFVFTDFNEAFGFLTRVALISEKIDHHANWSGVYNQVTLKLSSHDAGGLTERDFRFAGMAEGVAS